MNDEIEKVAPKVQTSWEAQREKSLAEAKEKMGDLGADEQLKSIGGIIIVAVAEAVHGRKP